MLADYRGAVASAQTPRAAIEQIVRSTSRTLSRHRAALAMLQNDWSYFAAQPRFAYLPKALREIERTWVTQLELGQQSGLFRADLDAKLTYRLLRDVLWIPEQWRRTRGYSTDQVVDAFLRILFEGIAQPGLTRPWRRRRAVSSMPIRAGAFTRAAGELDSCPGTYSAGLPACQPPGG